MVMQRGFEQKGNCDKFLLLSLLVLLLNFISQIWAFPVQCLLLVYAVKKCDIRLFPGMFLLMLDKSDFKMFAASPIKFNLGVALSPQNIFLLACFVVSMIGFLRNRFNGETTQWFFPWLSCVIPCFAMAMPARAQGLGMVWQWPIVMFLAPSLYFWGILVADSWEDGRVYFTSRMTLVIAAINMLEFFRVFHIFTFAENVLMLGLLSGCLVLRLNVLFKFVAYVGSGFAVANVFLSRYLQFKEKTGFSSSAELGSTYTRVMVVVIGILMIICLVYCRVKRSFVRCIPYMALAFCVIIFIYAVSQARGLNMEKEIRGTYTSSVERFKFKLIEDRGQLWNNSLEEVFKKPLFFKKLVDQLDFEAINYRTGERIVAVRLLPHNQVLTLIGRNGWWLGLFMVLFLWWTHVKAFSACSNMLGDRLMQSLLLAPSAAVFIAVGLTGQSVVSHLFCSNGLVTLIFPGIIYGAWDIRRRFRGDGNAHLVA